MQASEIDEIPSVMRALASKLAARSWFCRWLKASI
jgi:hypothetical protein